MDLDNNIIDVYQFHNSFRHIKDENRFVAELNAANLTVDWREVSVNDCHAVLHSLAKADSSQGQGFYELALALMSAIIYQNGPITDGHKYVRKIMRSDIVSDDLRKDYLNGWTIGEILMDRDLKLNKDKPDKSRFRWQKYNPDPLKTTGKCDIDDETAVYLLDETDGIFAWRDADGYLVLNISIDNSEDILVNEELMKNEIPLYFTASTHFQSPVWKMRTMKKAVQETLRHLEFPDVPIRFQIFLPGKTQMFINEEEMWDSYWKNLPLKIIRGKNERKRCEGAAVWPMQEVWECILVAAGKNYLRLKQMQESPF